MNFLTLTTQLKIKPELELAVYRKDYELKQVLKVKNPSRDETMINYLAYIDFENREKIFKYSGYKTGSMRKVIKMLNYYGLEDKLKVNYTHREIKETATKIKKKLTKPEIKELQILLNKLNYQSKGNNREYDILTALIIKYNLSRGYLAKCYNRDMKAVMVKAQKYGKLIE